MEVRPRNIRSSLQNQLAHWLEVPDNRDPMYNLVSSMMHFKIDEVVRRSDLALMFCRRASDPMHLRPRWSRRPCGTLPCGSRVVGSTPADCPLGSRIVGSTTLRAGLEGHVADCAVEVGSWGALRPTWKSGLGEGGHEPDACRQDSN